MEQVISHSADEVSPAQVTHTYSVCVCLFRYPIDEANANAGEALTNFYYYWRFASIRVKTNLKIFLIFNLENCKEKT